MAKRLPNKTSFKAGHAKHPDSGRPKLEEADAYLARERFSSEMMITFIEVLTMDLKSFYSEEQNDVQPAYRALMVSAINNGIQNGDIKVLDNVMNRIIGKPKDIVKIESDKPSDAEQYSEMKLELQSLILQGMQ